MKIASLAFALILLGGVTWVGAQDQKETKSEAGADVLKPFDFWMTVKLKESQKIFAALAESDFQSITDSTSTLITLNKVEEFVRKQNPNYRTQLNTFEFAVREIQTQAKKENVEGVALGFNQLTLSCVNCHKLLRDVSKSSP
jgi:cytochrome c556